MTSTTRPANPNPVRGEIWLVNFDPTIGAEIRKQRPAVVISVTTAGRLPLRIVTPITDWKAHYADFSWFVRLPPDTAHGLTKESGADCFQVKSLSVDRFIQRLGAVSEDEIADIAAGIALCVGYSP